MTVDAERIKGIDGRNCRLTKRESKRFLRQGDITHTCMLKLHLLKAMTEMMAKLMIIIYMDHDFQVFCRFRIKFYSLTRSFLSLTTYNVIMRMQKSKW